MTNVASGSVVPPKVAPGAREPLGPREPVALGDGVALAVGVE